MKKTWCLEVSGDFACFTRPEMKVERVSYDVITPSAARAVFEAILWKPVMRWQITKIEVLKPIRWINLRRNEVGRIASPLSEGIYIEDDRQQRASLLLRDVAYRLHGHFDLDRDLGRHRPSFRRSFEICVNPEEDERDSLSHVDPAKFNSMFERRASKGQCINQPYLGCREFACDFSLLTELSSEPDPIEDTRDLGWMLYDLDFDNPADPRPKFFHAYMQKGVIDLQYVEVRG